MPYIYESASVVATVTSQDRALPRDHGICGRPIVYYCYYYYYYYYYYYLLLLLLFYVFLFLLCKRRLLQILFRCVGLLLEVL